ncbi:MAG: GAF domain-containing protein [Sandaracinaceae bacterium]
MGESGGIPSGASVQVASDGTVTIHDGTARRSYVLGPGESESLAEKKPSRGPRVPSEPVPRTESKPPAAGSKTPSVTVPRPSDPPPSASKSTAPDAKVSNRTIAYNAKDMVLTPPGTAPAKPSDASAPEPKPSAAASGASLPTNPKRTIAYDASQLNLAAPGAPAASPGSPAMNATQAFDPKAVASVPTVTKPEAAPTAPTGAGPQRTIAYDARQLGLAAPEPAGNNGGADPKRTIAFDAEQIRAITATAQGAAEPAAQASAPASEPPKPATKPNATIAYDARALGLAGATPGGSAPAHPAPTPTVEDDSSNSDASDDSSPRMTDPDGTPAWQVLHSRDAEPSPDSPLVYRERTYVVAEGTSEPLLEAILSARFEELREELASRPKGKLVNMALFDHRWEGRPERPPLLTLQWKDWRGEPIVGRPKGSQPPPAVGPVSVPAPKPAFETPAKRSGADGGAESETAAKRSGADGAEDRVESPPSSRPPVATPEPAEAAPQPAPAPAHVDVGGPPSDDLDLSISDDVVDAPRPRERRRTDELLANAFEALQDLFFLTTPVEGLEFVVRLLGDLIPAQGYSTCLYDINTDELRFVAVAGPGGEAQKGRGVPRLRGLLGAAAIAPDAAVLIEDVVSDPRYDAATDGRPGVDIQTMALMAISHQGRLLGMVQLINRVDQSQFSRADANLLMYIGEKLGEFLFSARMRPDERRRGT